MRIVVALGGNALARRGEPMTAEYLRANVRSACGSLADLARTSELVITHGNGPQVGLLALQNLAYHEVASYPLDILGAESQGMIGYVVQQELANALHGAREVVGIITTTVVAEDDPAFERPTKQIGPAYSARDAAEAAAEYRWTIAKDGDAFRRVVPSPLPVTIVQAPLIRRLVEGGTLCVCVGGGGVPVWLDGAGRQIGVQAVVDKDQASATLATEIGADVLVMLTDTDYVVDGWGGARPREIVRASAEAIAELSFEEGTMQPKIDAAIQIARAGGRALIGPLDRLGDLLARRIGTEILPTPDVGISYLR